MRDPSGRTLTCLNCRWRRTIWPLNLLNLPPPILLFFCTKYNLPPWCEIALDLRFFFIIIPYNLSKIKVINLLFLLVILLFFYYEKLKFYRISRRCFMSTSRPVSQDDPMIVIATIVILLGLTALGASMSLWWSLNFQRHENFSVDLSDICR